MASTLFGSLARGVAAGRAGQREDAEAARIKEQQEADRALRLRAFEMAMQQQIAERQRQEAIDARGGLVRGTRPVDPTSVAGGLTIPGVGGKQTGVGGFTPDAAVGSAKLNLPGVQPAPNGRIETSPQLEDPTFRQLTGGYYEDDRPRQRSIRADLEASRLKREQELADAKAEHDRRLELARVQGEEQRRTVAARPPAAPRVSNPSEGERRAQFFASRADAAAQTLNQFDNQQALDAIASKAGFLGNWAKSPEGQQLEQAGKAWAMAVLRQDSGGVIGAEEMEEYFNTYLPRPGDTEATLAQKREARRVMEDGLRHLAGRAAPQGGGQQTGNVDLGGGGGLDALISKYGLEP